MPNMTGTAAPVFIPLVRLPDWLTLATAILATVFAAVCLWLAVRIINRREKWAKWTLACVFGPPALYVASFGPACWWFSSDRPPITRRFGGYSFQVPHAPLAYWPVGCVLVSGPKPIADAISWYATRRDEHVMLPFEPGGAGWVGTR